MKSLLTSALANYKAALFHPHRRGVSMWARRVYVHLFLLIGAACLIATVIGLASGRVISLITLVCSVVIVFNVLSIVQTWSETDEKNRRTERILAEMQAQADDLARWSHEQWSEKGEDGR